DVRADVKQICAQVNQRNPEISGSDAARKLKSIAASLEGQAKITVKERTEIAAIVREASPWSRLKADGYVAFENATIVQAFERIYAKSKAIGLLINREGELEGLCRDANQNPKATWLVEVLNRDLMTDPSLGDARKMLEELRACIQAVRQAAFVRRP